MCSALELHSRVFLAAVYLVYLTTDPYYCLLNFAILMEYMIMKLLIYFFGCHDGYLT